MNLARIERDYYVLELATVPALDGTWQASFDRGETWVNGVLVGDYWNWLVAGPDFDAAAVGQVAGDTQAVIAQDTVPWLRLADDPVLKVDYGPKIDLVA